MREHPQVFLFYGNQNLLIDEQVFEVTNKILLSDTRDLGFQCFSIEEILKGNEKFLTITKSIIFETNNFANRCFIAKDSKFPELTERYKKLYGTINSLRTKLDLPASSNLKPICN